MKEQELRACVYELYILDEVKEGVRVVMRSW